MKYTEMRMNQITNIVNRGGEELRKLNKAVAEHLDNLNLSDGARGVISATDLNVFADLWWIIYSGAGRGIYQRKL